MEYSLIKHLPQTFISNSVSNTWKKILKISLPNHYACSYVGKSKKIFKAVGVFPGALRLMGGVGRRDRISTNQRPVRIFSLVVFVWFSFLSGQIFHI